LGGSTIIAERDGGKLDDILELIANLKGMRGFAMWTRCGFHFCSHDSFLSEVEEV
jgi:hypothetical protein